MWVFGEVRHGVVEQRFGVGNEDMGGLAYGRRDVVVRSRQWIVVSGSGASMMIGTFGGITDALSQ